MRGRFRVVGLPDGEGRDAPRPGETEFEILTSVGMVVRGGLKVWTPEEWAREPEASRPGNATRLSNGCWYVIGPSSRAPAAW